LGTSTWCSHVSHSPAPGLGFVGCGGCEDMTAA
jgi:hypothetical protein